VRCAETAPPRWKGFSGKIVEEWRRVFGQRLTSKARGIAWKREIRRRRKSKSSTGSNSRDVCANGVREIG